MELSMTFKNDKLVGDFWGGLAAMLVALPSAIAFGVTIYAAIGPMMAWISPAFTSRLRPFSISLPSIRAWSSWIFSIVFRLSR